MITCANCGKQFNEPVEFCSRCGAPIDDTMYDDLEPVEDDILSINDLDEIETLILGLSAQQLDARLLEDKLIESDEDNNGLISLEELFSAISTMLDEDSASMFCDHFAETKNFTENGEVPIADVVKIWIDFADAKRSVGNPDNVVVVKEILDTYKKERQFLDPTNILLDDELDEFSYREAFGNMINLIDVNKDGKLTETEVRDFLSSFISADELDTKVSAFMSELHAHNSNSDNSEDDLFVDIDSISEIEHSLGILDIDSQILEDIGNVDELLDELNLPNFKDLSSDNIFSEFDDLEDDTSLPTETEAAPELKPEPELKEEIKPIFSRVRVKSAPVPEVSEEDLVPEKKDLSTLLNASDEELEALLNESGGDLDTMFTTSSDSNDNFEAPKFSIDNIFDDFEETPVQELTNRLNNNFQYDEDDDDDDYEDDSQDRFRAMQRELDDEDEDEDEGENEAANEADSEAEYNNNDNNNNDDSDDDSFNSFDSQFITDDYSPDVYEEPTDEDFSGVFEELLVSPDSFDEKIEQDEIDEALEYIKNNSEPDVSEVPTKTNKDFDNYEDVFEEAISTTKAKDAIFEDDISIGDVSAMGPDEFFTNEELTNALLDIKDLTDKKKDKKSDKKPSAFSKIKSVFFVDVKTGTMNTALFITIIVTMFSVYYVQKKPYQNTFYTNYSEDALTSYDQATWDTYLSVVGFNDLFLIYANAYLEGELSKTEFLDVGYEYISHNTRASNTFLTNTYPEASEYTYNLHLYTFRFTEAADKILISVSSNAPESEIQMYLSSMESMETVDTDVLLEREEFIHDVGLYN